MGVGTFGDMCGIETTTSHSVGTAIRGEDMTTNTREVAALVTVVVVINDLSCSSAAM